MRTFAPLTQDDRPLTLACNLSRLPFIAGHGTLHQGEVLFVDGRGRRHLAPLHLILGVSRITVNHDVLGFGHPSSEGGPIGSCTMSRPRARDSVNAFTEGEEGDRKTMNKDRTEDDKGYNRLNGHRQEFGLGLRIINLRRLWQLLNGQSRDEYCA